MSTTRALPDVADRGLLGHTSNGEPLPSLRKRMTPLHFRGSMAWGWYAPLLVTLFVGIFQFWGLGYPHKITFDETYYAKDAYALLTQHYSEGFIDNPATPNVNEADQEINHGSTQDIFTGQPEEVVHPEVGKWMIAFGEWVFGLNPFGWRFSSAFIGTLMILVMCRLVRRLTGSTMLGCVAGLLLGFDGLHFVMSRFALLDIFLAFWLLCAAHCLIADRDWARLKLAKRHETTPKRSRWSFGPVRGFLFRPWRITAGVCFGLACGTKWSGVYVMAGFLLVMWSWDAGMRRAAGVRWSGLKSLVVDEIPAFFSVVLLGLVVYVCTWMAFLTHAQKFEATFGQGEYTGGKPWSSNNDFGGHPTGFFENTLHALHVLWNYHVLVYDFHTGSYIDHATHPFQSNPGGWLLINRPLGVDAMSGGSDKVPGCPPGESCVRQVLAIGTPILWWFGVAALIVGLFYWLSRRDWRFGLPIVGVLLGWLPWFRYDVRPIFYYYAVAFVPFTVIAVTLVLGKMLGPANASERRRVFGVLTAGLVVVLVAANFIYFYPILTDGLLTNRQWNNRMWLTHWIYSHSAPPERLFEGRIAGFGTASGTRIVMGDWRSSPFGAFADVMVEQPDGTRILLAPTDEVANDVSTTYAFDRVVTTRVSVTQDQAGVHIDAGPLSVVLGLGGRTRLGWALRCLPRRLAVNRRWLSCIAPVVPLIAHGVRVTGSAGNGRREWYGATDVHRIVTACASWDGDDLGELRRVEPPPRFGFSSTPALPCIVDVVTTIHEGA